MNKGENIPLTDVIKNYIPVTRPYLPPLEEFTPYLEEIWNTKCLTNNGNFHLQLEEELCKYLGVKYISLFANGTLALITALQAMKITGNVITTPFSFVATSHSLIWNKIMPVFIDIEPDTYNIDPGKIESKITPNTTAIMPVHVYGNPCDVIEIEKIARKHQLKVIYDAAHAFGVRIMGNSVLNYGDLSVLSFHATKVFNTFEGGAIVSHNEKTKQSIDHLKNFGITGENTVASPGINGKMNEIQAAFGLLQLKYIDRIIEKREHITKKYRQAFNNINYIRCLPDIPGISHNYSYFPILVESKMKGNSRDELYDRLKENGVWSRKYFYPLISTFKPYNSLPSSNPSELKTAHTIAAKILCLPIYPDLEEKEQEKIIKIVTKSIR